MTDVSCVIRVHTHGQMESIFLKTSLIAVIPLACVASVSVLFYARSALASNFRAAINRKSFKPAESSMETLAMEAIIPHKLDMFFFKSL